jgi:F-type H+/Na+-transporting ATPase subunit alpha
LNQGERDPMAVGDQVAAVYAATNGYVDRILTSKVPDFLGRLVERLHAEIPDTLEKLAEGDWSDEIQKQLDEGVAQFAEDYGYDLDEEGKPLEGAEAAEAERTLAQRAAHEEEEEKAKDEEAAGAAA